MKVDSPLLFLLCYHALTAAIPFSTSHPSPHYFRSLSCFFFASSIFFMDFSSHPAIHLLSIPFAFAQSCYQKHPSLVLQSEYGYALTGIKLLFTGYPNGRLLISSSR